MSESDVLFGHLITFWLLTQYRLIVVAVFSLCIGHPGFIFREKEDQKYASVSCTELK